ncbi:MAG TPA: radical SAM protein [Polyangiaceae bacterium]
MLERVIRRVDLVARLAETWVRRPDGPTRLVFQVTRRCNLRCEMCKTWTLDGGHELTLEEIRRVLSEVPKLAWLDLTGGEPFLRADVLELLETVADGSPRLRVLHFPTNGWFTSRVVEACRLVVRKRPDLDFIVTVSIDGPPDVHDAMRGRPGSFARALATYRALRAIPGMRVYVGTTVTPSNQASLDALGDVLAAEIPGFSPREWHWNWMQISQHYFANGDLGAARDAIDAGSSVREHARRRGAPRSLLDLMELAFLVNLDAYQRGEPVGFSCQALRSSLFLSPEGDVYPCHVYDRPLGNVRQQSVGAIWRSADVERARSDIERLACGGCFTPCEAYPMLAGAPVRATTRTVRRSLRLLREAAS